MQQHVKPKYQVKRLQGTVKRTIIVLTEKGFVRREKEEDAGFMVFLPSGNSFRARNEDELKRLNIDPDRLPLVDMDSGESMGELRMNLDLESQSQARSSSRRQGARAATAEK